MRRACPAALAAALLLAGCSAFRSPYQMLTVQSNEPGATVFINGRESGVTPTTVQVRRDQPAQVLVRKPGFEDSSKTVDVHWNKTAALDFIGGVFLLGLPALGLFAPGANSLDTEFVSLQLFPLPEAKAPAPATAP